MPAFRQEPGWDRRRKSWDYDAELVYGWDEDMTQEIRLIYPGPITKEMTKDEHAIPELLVRGDRTYVFKHCEYILTREAMIEAARQEGYDRGARASSGPRPFSFLPGMGSGCAC